MEPIFDDAHQHVLHQHLARRWIREGGIVVAKGTARAGNRSTFDYVETVASGVTLQVTFNLKEVSKACKFLSDYAVYLWNCDHDGEYVLCGLLESDPYVSNVPSTARGATRQYWRVAPTCYAGRYPDLRLDIYDAELAASSAPRAAIMTRMLLPRGLCAAIYQSKVPIAAGWAEFSEPRDWRTSQTIAEDA